MKINRFWVKLEDKTPLNSSPYHLIAWGGSMNSFEEADSNARERLKLISEKLSSISIDFFTLAFGPIHHKINMRAPRSNKVIGVLQYNVLFEQV